MHLCFLNFLIKIIFLFDQMIIKTDKQIINWLNKIKRKKIYKATNIFWKYFFFQKENSSIQKIFISIKKNFLIYSVF